MQTQRKALKVLGSFLAVARLGAIDDQDFSLFEGGASFAATGSPVSSQTTGGHGRRNGRAE